MLEVWSLLDISLPLSEVAGQAQRVEALGYDGLAVPDLVHDGIAAAALAVHATERLQIATHALVAFPRSPMVVANLGWDLQTQSGGRFVLGLGTQVKGHNERRFGVPWSAPVPRLREYIESLRAIWTSWQTGEPLDYRGDHYQFTLMTPEFRPEPNDQPMCRSPSQRSARPCRSWRDASATVCGCTVS